MAGGHIINEYIIINCTSPDIDPNNKSIHFLTNVGRHHKSMKDVISDHVERIYTSEFNVWYLTTFFRADSSKFTPVALYQKKQVKCCGKRISFEFLDANHCAGSVMILFKGDFGTYLYTGNCRYTSDMLDYKSLRPFTKGNKELDRLYINGAFKKLGYNFPPKTVVIKQITDFIRRRKEETIYICCRQLGKEDILAAVAKQLNEVVCVTGEKMRILKKLGYSPSLFTLEPAGSRIRLLPPSEVTWLKMKKRIEKEKCCAIVMSGCSKSTDQEASNGIFKFAASDHSSASETQAMIERISARAVHFLNAGVSRPRSIRTKVPYNGVSNSSEEPIVQFDIVNLPLVIPPPLPSAAPLPEEIEIVPPPPPPEVPLSSHPKVVVERVESSDSSIRFNLESSSGTEEINLLPPSFEIIGPSTVLKEVSTSGNVVIPDTLSLGTESVQTIPENTTSSTSGLIITQEQLAQESKTNSLSLELPEPYQNLNRPSCRSPQNYQNCQLLGLVPDPSDQLNLIHSHLLPNESPENPSTDAISLLNACDSLELNNPCTTTGPLSSSHNSLEGLTMPSVSLEESPNSGIHKSREFNTYDRSNTGVTELREELFTDELTADSYHVTERISRKNLLSHSGKRKEEQQKRLSKAFPFNQSDNSSSGFGFSLSVIEEESRFVSSSDLSGEKSRTQNISHHVSKQGLHTSSNACSSSLQKSRPSSHQPPRNPKLSLRSSSNIQNSPKKSLQKSQFKVPFNLKLYEFFRSSCTNVEIS